jgi:hypothetical protein
MDHKADLVFQTANYLSNRTYYLSEVSLYTLDGLLVEVWYYPNDNSIKKIETALTESLHLYCLDVDLTKLNP